MSKITERDHCAHRRAIDHGRGYSRPCHAETRCERCDGERVSRAGKKKVHEPTGLPSLLSFRCSQAARRFAAYFSRCQLGRAPRGLQNRARKNVRDRDGFCGIVVPLLAARCLGDGDRRKNIYAICGRTKREREREDGRSLDFHELS